MESQAAKTQATQVLLDGIAFGECARWHDGRFWFSDWVADELVAVDADGGNREVVAKIGALPFSFAWTPEGTMLVTAGQKLLRMEADGSLVTHAELGELSPHGWNEIVVDGRGNAFVNNVNFDLMGGGEFQPGIIAVVEPDGSARQVADGMAFPNGMAVTPDNATLIIAESYAGRLTAFDIAADGSLGNRRVWAELGEGGDGICIDADGAVWTPAFNKCIRVAEGGEVLATVELERFGFACALGGEDRRTLFIMSQDWNGPEHMFDEPRTGQVLTAPAPAAGVGWP